MTLRSFWTRERRLPGQAPVEDAVGIYWVLKLLHPPSAAAMLLGAVSFGIVGWRLTRDTSLVGGLLVTAFAAFIGAWVGLLFYWLARLFFAMHD